MNLLQTFVSISIYGFNWVDICIFIIVFIYALEGFFMGFVASLFDFISFVLSFLFGLSFFSFAGGFLSKSFSIPLGFANAIGFFVIAVLSEVILGRIFRIFYVGFKIPAGLASSKNFMTLNRILGIFPGILSGLLLVSFVLSLIVALPFSVFLKDSVSKSEIGNVLVANTQGLAKNVNGVFGGAVNETLSFLTVEPKSNEIVQLNFKVTKFSIDYKAEQQMFEMVNRERTSRGIHALSLSNALTQVGRAHCEDMFKRGYFSHYTPEGLSPFDRMDNAGITFNYAGENLALAPNVDLAMRGLMQSPGHRANILSQNFNKIGVGVINGGIYGEMFCQEFTD